MTNLEKLLAEAEFEATKAGNDVTTEIIIRRLVAVVRRQRKYIDDEASLLLDGPTKAVLADCNALAAGKGER